MKIVRTIWLLIMYTVLSASNNSELPQGFVYLSDIDPSIMQEMMYASSENFMGKKVNGYERPVAILRKEPAEALKRVQSKLKEHGLGLKVFDAYRPQDAVDHFKAWSLDSADNKNKDRYYPTIDKKDLFERGYIAERSVHSRGLAVDLSLIYLSNSQELDMGTIMDYLGELASHDNPNVSEEAQKNRKLLRSVMEAEGFKAYEKEWWHYNFHLPQDEEKIYYNFPVR